MAGDARRVDESGRRCSEFSASLTIGIFAVNGRLRCANRPYMMWPIVTSPSSPVLLPLFVIKSGRREQICSADWTLALWFG